MPVQAAPRTIRNPLSGLLDALIPESIDRRGIGVPAFGHAAADLCQGVLPALLPFLVAERGYSYGAATALLLFASVGSSLLQPLLGIYADRIRASWLMPLGTGLGAVGIGLVGFAPTYLTTGAALVVSSVGVAMFHPEGVRFAGYVAEASGRHGTGMSFFALGGMTGWALGPILTTPAVYLLGLHGTALVALVPAAAAVLLAANLGYLERFRPGPTASAAARSALEAASQWGTFSIAAGAAIVRTGVQFSLQALVPLYAWKVLGTSQALGNATVTTLLVAGAAGTLFGGRLADRIGFRAVVVRSLAITAPLVVAVAHVPLAGVFVLVVLIGLAMEANFYPLVVVAQRALPRHVGFASGVMLGLSIGCGAGITALFGQIADHEGLRTAIQGIGVLAASAAVLALLLPRPARDAAA